MPENEPSQKSDSSIVKSSDVSFAVPGAIVLAGVIVAGAIVLVGSGVTPRDSQIASPSDSTPEVGNVTLVPGEEHVLGTLESPIVIVEFSDLECPYCKMFHETMKQVMEEYGETNEVAWVYRHFPLVSIHPKAPKEAEATECAAELGGELAFWKYVDRIFEITPSNNGLDLALLPDVAEELGLPRSAFEECLASGRHANAVEDDLKAALEAGARGTPYSILLLKDGNPIPVSGAQPFDALKATIDEMLNAD